MNNIRHISIFNELRLTCFDNGANFFTQILKNMSIVDLLPSKKYKISNLSIDMGSCIFFSKEVYFSSTRKFTIPLRFFLDNDPLVNEFFRFKNQYPSDTFFVNNSTVTNVSQLPPPTALDIVDSSNVDFDNARYYNSIGLNSIGPSPELNLQLLKTQTVAEFNFFSFIYSRITENPNKYVYPEMSNNDISDFHFDSKSFNFLCISPYPFIKYFILNADFELNADFNFTINFDLEELD